jgi:Holliday junction resolvase
LIFSASSTVWKGQYAEYAVQKKLESLGYNFIIKSNASRGPIDLLCANESGDLLAVQVKSAKHGTYLSSKELERLVDWSDKFNAKPVFAFKKNGRWILKHLATKLKTEEGKQSLLAQYAEDSGSSLYDSLMQELIEESSNEF